MEEPEEEPEDDHLNKDLTPEMLLRDQLRDPRLPVLLTRGVKLKLIVDVVEEELE